MKIYAAGLIALGLPIALWLLFGGSHPTLRVVESGEMVAYDIADSDETRRQGLSDRAALGNSHSMLFVFEQERLPSFWMKDMRFDLDIIWIRADKTVSDISYDVKKESYPETVSPSEEILYVLEVNAGQTERLGIAPGVSLDF